MQKKIIALAIASALTVPALAFADTSNVTVYGRMHVSYDHFDVDTNSNDTGQFLSNNSSRLGFKGNEDLGNGLKAVWQFETGVAADGEGGPFNSIRDTFVGLSGSFGTVTAGRQAWDNLFAHDANMFSDQIGAPSVWIDASGRANNTIKYASPNMSGFDASLTYVTPGGFTGESTADNLEHSYALKGTYNNGPLFASLTYLSKGTIKSAEEWKTTSIAARYDFGVGKVVAQYVDYRDYNGVSGDDRDVITIGGNYKVTGNGTLKAQFTKVDHDANDMGADMITIGYDHSLSKRTTAYVAYSRVNNDSKGAYNVSGSGHGAKPATIGANTDPTGLSFGLAHDF